MRGDIRGARNNLLFEPAMTAPQMSRREQVNTYFRSRMKARRKAWRLALLREQTPSVRDVRRPLMNVGFEQACRTKRKGGDYELRRCVLLLKEGLESSGLRLH